MNFSNKTKAQLIEIIEAKENELLDLREDLRQLEKCKKYEDAADEIRSMYENLMERGFDDEAALKIVRTMIESNHLPERRYGSRSSVSYQSYRDHR